MVEHEVVMLKAALYNQYTIMRKLCLELEEEREASATATSEALSMILRLEREKSAAKMEASQYKRMAEERMQHAEECLVILEEVMQQKEEEISDLKAHIQEYKEKLSSIDNEGAHSQSILTEKNLIPFENNVVMKKTNRNYPLKRNNSMPSLSLGTVPWETDADSQNCTSFHWDKPRWQRVGEYKDQMPQSSKDSKSLEGNVIDDYTPEVTGKMKYVVSQNTRYQTAKGEDSRSSSKGSSLRNSKHSNPSTSFSSAFGSIKILPDSRDSSSSQADEHENELGCDRLGISSKQIKLKGMTMQTPCTLDIFEVPERCYMPSGHRESFWDESVKGTKPAKCREDLVPRERMEHACLNDISLQESCGSNFSTPRKGASMHQTSKSSSSAVNNSFTNYTSAPVNHETGGSFSEHHFQIKCQLQQLEDESKLKLENSERNNDQLKLLRDIYDQLNNIEHHLKASPCSKSMNDESKLVYVMEAFLSFSI